jgi:hypothetical protein
MVYRKIITIEKAALVGDEYGTCKGTYRGDAGKLIKPGRTTIEPVISIGSAKQRRKALGAIPEPFAVSACGARRKTPMPCTRS